MQTVHNTPPEVNQKTVLEKCDYFSEVTLWPMKQHLDPEPWLRNFNEAELPFALHLLNQFFFFSDELVNEIFASAFKNLSL